MHNALWPFLISQVLLVLTDHQEEFAISLAFERSCSPVWYKFTLTLGVVDSPTTICIFAAHSPEEIVLAGFGTKVCNVFESTLLHMAWLEKIYMSKVIKNQSNEKTSLRPRSKRVDGAQWMLHPCLSSLTHT